MATAAKANRAPGAGAATVEDEPQGSKLQIFTCTKCGQKFEVGDWICKDGKVHEVKEKTYYAPVGSLRVYVEEEQIISIGNGQTRMKPARLVEFSRGVFRTSNPIDQNSLDTTDNGLISVEQWQKIFISPAELNEMKQRELDQRERRIVEREQALLAKVKGQTEGQTA